MINKIILTIYCFLLLITRLFIITSSFKSTFFLSFLFLPAIYFLVSISLDKIKFFSLRSHTINRKHKCIIFTVAFFISLFVLILDYLGNMPGGFVPDCIGQYEQAIKGAYSDWHPVIHTLLFYTLPYLITKSFLFIIPFQLILFSLTLGFLCETIYEFSSKKLCILTLLFIILNPNVLHIVMVPLKDVAFAIAGICSYLVVIRAYLGKKDINIKWIIFLVIALSLATLFRHNSILFTAPLMFSLFFIVNKKKALIIAITTLMTIFCIKLPLYSCLKVESPDRRVIETAGLPLTIISSAIAYSPELLDNDVKIFAYKITDQETWTQNYIEGTFNSIKFGFSNLDNIENYSLFDIIGISFKCIKESPVYSIRGAIALTDLVYGIDIGSYEYTFGNITISDNELGIKYNGIQTIRNYFDTYYSLTTNSIAKYIFGSYGLMNLVMLIFILGKHNLRSKKSWVNILLCLPIFVYNFGTMLLLTGDDWRFFFITILALPLVLLLCLKNKNEEII